MTGVTRGSRHAAAGTGRLAVEASGRLVGDIGGTSARFALLDAAGRPVAARRLAVRDYANFSDALAAYLTGQDATVQSACLAVAAPVAGDRIVFTNSPWHFSAAALKRRFGWRDCVVINDFAAQAHAIPHLRPRELRRVGGGRRRAAATVAILGPGTGLGVSALVRAADAAGPALAVSGEGGHVGLAPRDAVEEEILGHLRRAYGRVSAERVLCGAGLVALYRALAAVRGAAPEALTAADVTGRALAGTCDLCGEALERFCRFLGTVAGDLALTMGALGGVYIAGGMVPRFADFFAGSGFRRAFEDKGRLSPYVAAIPTYLVLAETPALRGAAAALLLHR